MENQREDNKTFSNYNTNDPLQYNKQTSYENLNNKQKHKHSKISNKLNNNTNNNEKIKINNEKSIRNSNNNQINRQNSPRKAEIESNISENYKEKEKAFTPIESKSLFYQDYNKNNIELSQMNNNEINKNSLQKNNNNLVVNNPKQVNNNIVLTNAPAPHSETIKEEKNRIEVGEKNPNISNNQNYPNNKIITTKYNVLTWAPKSLLIQFRRAANVYFLIVTILTCMSFSPKQPISMIGTFVFVLIVTMIKEAVEDYHRYKQDKQSNNRLVYKLETGVWNKVLCWTLKPGDIIKVEKEEEFSADTLIIQSTNDTGYCYIDTKNLDGETNLKEKCSLEVFKSFPEAQISQLEFYIDVEKPNENLTYWKGIVNYKKNDIFCSLANLILKGSILKNTKYIVGLIIYSGKNTKIMKNSKAPRMKVSKVLYTMNRLLYSVFIFEIGLCLTFAILSANWTNQYLYIYKYIFSQKVDDIKSNFTNIVINFFTFFVAYSHMIPISLYVALEIVKIIQGLLIYYDNEIYDSLIDKPASCRTTGLIEELGQVEFIFSDKTGTLTQNSMILKKVYINGKVYGSMQDEHPDTFNSINGDMSIFNKLKKQDNLERKESVDNFNYDITNKYNFSGSGKNLNLVNSYIGNNNKLYFNFQNKKSKSVNHKNESMPTTSTTNFAEYKNNLILNQNIYFNRQRKSHYNFDISKYKMKNSIDYFNNNKTSFKLFNRNFKSLFKIQPNTQRENFEETKQAENDVNVHDLSTPHDNNHINNAENIVSNNSENSIESNNNEVKNKNNVDLKNAFNSNTINSYSKYYKDSVLNQANSNNLNKIEEEKSDSKRNNSKHNNNTYLNEKESNVTNDSYKDDHNINIKSKVKTRLIMTDIVEKKENHDYFNNLNNSNRDVMPSEKKLKSSSLDIKKKNNHLKINEDMNLEYSNNNSLQPNPNSELEMDRKMILDFFYLLTLCHACFPEMGKDNKIIYQGASPDDIALVKGAQQMGFEYIEKEFSEMTIKNHINDDQKKFDLKVEFPFDSDRKRMSVIVQDKETKEYKLLSKGADTVMLIRMRLDIVELEEINRVIKVLSKEGLRVLVIGSKTLTEKEFNNWYKTYSEDRNNGKDLTKLYEQMETTLNFMGLTAIEDKLQDGVPDTIYTLLTCNIRVWVLTGDKQDTAEEIAKSCKLINDNMFILYLLKDGVSPREKLNNLMDKYGLKLLGLQQNEDIIDLEFITKKIRKKEGKDLSIIIDGVTLEEILNDKDLSYSFFKISIAAKSVVCCRVSPKQKSKVVQLVKKYGKWVTLSIGDGANDVPMIMEAHIGVGIQGKEGTQAVRSADFSIGQFRFLEKLLLIYGRVGYMKISKFICYYFYKNIILVFTDIFFAFSNGFSGQIYFADWLSTLYNAIFTSWPCLFTFSFERDLDLSIIKKFPILYVAGQKNYFFNLKIFWGYILYAIFHGFICFYVPNLGMLNSNDQTGVTFNHWYKSTTSFSLVIEIVTIKLMVISDFWNGLNIFAFFFSIILYYIILIIFCFKPISVVLQNELSGLIFNLFSYPKFWLVILIAPFLALLPDITMKQIFYSVYPNPTEYIKQYLHDPIFLNMVFNDEHQSIILNSQAARRAEKNLQEILKQARALKLKKKLVDKNTLEASDLPLKDNYDNDLFTNDRTTRKLLEQTNHIKIHKKRKGSKHKKHGKNFKGLVNQNYHNKYNLNAETENERTGEIDYISSASPSPVNADENSNMDNNSDNYDHEEIENESFSCREDENNEISEKDYTNNGEEDEYSYTSKNNNFSEMSSHSNNHQEDYSPTNLAYRSQNKSQEFNSNSYSNHNNSKSLENKNPSVNSPNKQTGKFRTSLLSGQPIKLNSKTKLSMIKNSFNINELEQKENEEKERENIQKILRSKTLAMLEKLKYKHDKMNSIKKLKTKEKKDYNKNSVESFNSSNSSQNYSNSNSASDISNSENGEEEEYKKDNTTPNNEAKGSNNDEMLLIRDNSNNSRKQFSVESKNDNENLFITNNNQLVRISPRPKDANIRNKVVNRTNSKISNYSNNNDFKNSYLNISKMNYHENENLLLNRNENKMTNNMFNLSKNGNNNDFASVLNEDARIKRIKK